MGKKSSHKKQKKVTSDIEKNIHDVEKADGSAVAVESRFIRLRQKMLALVLMIASLVALAFFAIFIWGELTKPLSISKFIPQDAIGFIELDTNLEGVSWQNYHNLSAQKNIPAISNLIEKINTTLNVDIMKEVYPWLSRRAGIALLSDMKAVLFLEVRDATQALDFFRKHRLKSITEDLQEQDIDGVKTYHYIASSTLSLTVLGNYLIVASDEGAMRQIIQATKNTSLFVNRQFQRIHNAIPQKNRLGFIFARPGQLTQIVPSIPKPWSQTLMQDFIAEGASIKALDNFFAIEHLALFSNKPSGPTEKDSTPPPRQKYRAELMDAFSDKTQLYIGGQDIGRIRETIGRISDQSIFDYTKTIIKKTFDGEISFEEMQKLLRGEYALGLDDGAWKMAIQLTNSDEDKKVLQKIIRGVESSRIFFPPVIEDGTVKGSAKSMKKSETEYRGMTIQAMEIEGEMRGLYLATDNQKAMITFSLEAMRRMIDLVSTAGTLENISLKKTSSYETFIAPQLTNADDMIYARPHTLEDMLPDPLKFLRTLSEISLATNSFEDGMKTIILASP